MPYRVYVRKLGALLYVGSYRSFEVAELHARANGGFVTMRKDVWSDSSADSLTAAPACPHSTR